MEYYDEKGLLHRLDGPALEYSNGTKMWFQNGKNIDWMDPQWCIVMAI